MHDVILTIYLFMWFMLVALAVLFIISGLDDLFFDIFYWIRWPYRLWKQRSYKALTYEQLLSTPEKLIAVLVPCWQEANVIGNMLRHNCSSIDYDKYIIFVGVYPNDPMTAAEVEAVAIHDKHVLCVMGHTPGPTNKAANLNQLYQAAKQREAEHGEMFDIILFHDSEDVIHPLSFKLYNYLIPRKDMIQLPVFPLEVPHRNLTHWLYADEFSEAHTKNIIVREALKLHVPSAGVGTAFSRRALTALAEESGGRPFEENSLTEDYRTSFRIRACGFKPIFLTQYILRTKWVKRGIFKKRYIQKTVKEHVATRAMFPQNYFQAVRQKSRWIIGIVFQEWENSPWPKSWRLRYSLAHDRKAFMTHFINGSAYFLLAFWLVYGAGTANHPSYPALQEQFNMHPWVWWLILTGTFMMCMRLLQRMIATHRVYGKVAASLTLIRACYGNLLNLHALIRAYRLYFLSINRRKQAKPVVWDKTEHQFPGRHILVPFKRRIGDLLLEEGLITESQLHEALLLHKKTGERLGDVLIRLRMITQHELFPWLGKQYALQLFPGSQLEKTREACKMCLPKKQMRWLVNVGLFLIAFDVPTQNLTLGLEDPTNEILIAAAKRRFSACKVSFVLIDPSN
ncbi:MAG: glycosyl transferase family protein [Legionellaceae bacterium]|nr:glycosyl transferase family protein [Legionellaceae bacterium]